MVCDRRILQGGWWHIRRARGDLVGDVHRGCAVARNVERERDIYIYTYRQGDRDGEIKEQYIMEFTSGVTWWLYRKNTWEIISRQKSGRGNAIHVGCTAKSNCVSKYCVSFDITSCCHIEKSVQSRKVSTFSSEIATRFTEHPTMTSLKVISLINFTIGM